MKSWFHDKDIEMYSKHNEEKSVVLETFIRTLKNNIYNYMTSVSKNVYIVKLDDTFNKYNNTCHRNIKQKTVNVKLSTKFDFGIANNEKHTKFEIGDQLKK